MKKCNQCWKALVPDDVHECPACVERRRGGYTRVGRSPDLDLPGLRITWRPESNVGKLGGIPSSTTSGSTCPDACSLKGNGCYAEFGFGGHQWRRLSRGEVGITWEAFLEKVRALPRGTLWRHNLAGDLPGERDAIDEEKLQELVDANRLRCGFTFTHKPLTPANVALVQAAVEGGLAVNVSTESVEEAERVKATLGLPVVVVVAHDAPVTTRTSRGLEVKLCPAQRTGDAATCATCGWCANPERWWAVGFRAHGQMQRRVSLEVVR